MSDDIIVSRDEFDIRQILDCGQVFRYNYEDGGYTVYSGDRRCRVIQTDAEARIISDDPDYFRAYFDLDTDYGAIRTALKGKPFMDEAVEYGKGIRILRQQHYETLISFIISANNHIPRIKGIIGRLCDALGEDMGGYRAFPTAEAMADRSAAFYASLGAGYRAEYLADTAKRVADGFDLEAPCAMESDSANKYLCSLKGVGPKVADCILLFAYRKFDVFPVDTWIRKVYADIAGESAANAKIRRQLTSIYGGLAGVAQQYLFFHKRETAGR